MMLNQAQVDTLEPGRTKNKISSYRDIVAHIKKINGAVANGAIAEANLNRAAV